MQLLANKNNHLSIQLGNYCNKLELKVLLKKMCGYNTSNKTW